MSMCTLFHSWTIKFLMSCLVTVETSDYNTEVCLCLLDILCLGVQLKLVEDITTLPEANPPWPLLFQFAQLQMSTWHYMGYLTTAHMCCITAKQGFLPLAPRKSALWVLIAKNKVLSCCTLWLETTDLKNCSHDRFCCISCWFFWQEHGTKSV